MLELDISTAEKNWKTYEKLASKLSSESVTSLVESMGERICLAPAATHTDTAGCYRGGLVQNALMITSYMRKLNDMYELDIPTQSIIKVGLFHDVGRVGDLEDNLLIEQDSKWHREKLGQIFKYNEEVEKIKLAVKNSSIKRMVNILLTWIID